MRKVSGLGLFLILFLVSLTIYSKSLNGDFLFDDKSLIVGNEDIKHLNTIPLLFTSRVFKFAFPVFESSYSYYRPVSGLLSAIIYRLSGLNPLGYHMVNVVIHSLNALLVFYLIYKLFANYPLAMLTSLLFCVHPAHTETVNYISSLAELLVSLFVLLTMVSYFAYTESRKGITYIISISSFVLALLSREAGFLIFVPFFLLIIGLRSKLSRNSVFVHFFSFFGVLLLYIKLRLTVLVPIQSFPNSSSTLLLDILNFFNVLAQYIKLLAFPQALHIFRSIVPVNSINAGSAILPVLFITILLVITAVAIKQKKYVLLFGLAWFIFGLLHLIKFMYKFRVLIAMEEHWVYLACVGFFVIVSWLVLSVKPRKFAMAISSALLIIYASVTFVYAGHWKDEIDFYRYNLKLIEPSLSVVPRLNFATALSERKLYNEAIEQVGVIMSIAPNNLYAYIELGDIYYEMKKYPEAKEAYQNALKIDYFCWQANRKLKLLAKVTGQAYKDELDPRLSPVEAQVVSFLRLGEFDKALEVLREKTKESPSVQIYTLSGITFGKMGLNQQAIEAFNDALKIDPENYQALYNLAVIYENRHEKNKALKVRERMSRIQQRLK